MVVELRNIAKLTATQLPLCQHISGSLGGGAPGRGKGLLFLRTGGGEPGTSRLSGRLL